LIKLLAPVFNKIHNEGVAEPWRYSLLPIDDKDLFLWMKHLGTRQVAARVLLAKPWSKLRKYNIDPIELLSKVEYEGAYYGERC
jgi:hypothetical protein